jgi:hypothetical protein
MSVVKKWYLFVVGELVEIKSQLPQLLTLLISSEQYNFNNFANTKQKPFSAIDSC